MAIIEKKYQIDVNHVGSSNLLSNHGVLCLLESIACYHSNMVGFGINDIKKTNLTWVLLHWKVKIFKRLPYGSIVTVKTWARSCNKVSTLRDFEIYDETGLLICIASSKWTLIDLKTNSIAKITPEIIGVYEPEEKSVFNEKDIAKLKPLETSNIPDYTFKVLRRDIDVNNHMHNIYYLDYAYETLPLNIYEENESNEFEIMYKSGAKLNSDVACYFIPKITDFDNNYKNSRLLNENCTAIYSEGKSIIIMKSADGKQLYAIVAFI